MDLYERIRAMADAAPKPKPKSRQGFGRGEEEEPVVELDAPQDDSPIVAALGGALVTGRQLRRRLQEAPARRQAADTALGGEVLETPQGSCLVKRSFYPLDEPHGRYAMQGLCGIDWPALARLVRLDPNADINPRRLAIVDTETTGLGGATGTFAFLIGLAYLDEDGVRVEQYLMRDYCEEPAQLDAVCQSLQARGIDSVVSYNGKSFDLPLLVGRFIQNRMPNPLGDVEHIDLLHTARRLWRARLGSCSLGMLEERILGLEREDDVPGAMIPRIFLDYVRGVGVERMVNVFHHNALDLVSLAALLGYLSEWDADFLAAGYPQTDRYCLGRCYEIDGRTERAERIYRNLLEEGLDDAGEETMLRLAFMYKRLRDYEKAVELWRTTIQRSPGFNPTPYEELAKYLEHKAKDFNQAKQVVEEALNYLDMERWIDSDPYEGRGGDPAERLRRRLERIERKRAKRKA